MSQEIESHNLTETKKGSLNWQKIQAAQISDSPDEESQAEEKLYKNDKADFEKEKASLLHTHVIESRIRNKILKKYLTYIGDEQENRIKYSKKLFKIAFYYIAISLIMVLLNKSYFDYGNYRIGLNIDEKVLMALVGSTSINVIGMVLVVLKFIFTNHHHKILDKNN